MQPSTSFTATTFLRFGILFFTLAWSIWSLRKLWTAIQEVIDNWGRWETYPVPDKRAANNLAWVFLILSGWSLFTAGLVFGLAWALGV